MTDQPSQTVTAGGLVDPSGSDAEPPPRAAALRALRAGHAQRRFLELRRLEVRVALNEQRRVIAELEATAAVRAQGPVEEVRFVRATQAGAALAVEARHIDQQLRALHRTVRRREARAVAEVARR
jgi:hypothetical protein